ncbi:MAG: hypothetical protein K0R78_369 [Pelosinus sp.]|jgi:hypothetical protein|nr:hypothetical protein [Pelosinus sp.]
MKEGENIKEQSVNHYYIEARAFLIPYTPFTHNFWVLANSKNGLIDQLHGLAFNPETRTTRAIGSSADLLQVIRNANITWSLQQNQPINSCITGNEAEVRQRWQAALNAIHAINALELPYPNFWQHFYKKNSNTIFNTLGQIMGVASPAQLLPTWAPGIDLTISQDIIDHYRYKE